MAFNLTPQSLISNAIALFDLLSLGGADSVGIYDQTTFNQVFTDARPLEARVLETTRIMQHPIETGASLADHHIINPIEIDYYAVIKSPFYLSTYEQIKQAMIAAILLTVSTKSGTYSNMIIKDIPHQEKPEMFDSITINIRLQEILFVVPASVSPSPAPSNYAPAAPANSNTQSLGQKYTAPLVTNDGFFSISRDF